MTSEEFCRLKELLKKPAQYKRIKKKYAFDSDEEFGRALDRVRREVLAEMRASFFAEVDRINK